MDWNSEEDNLYGMEYIYDFLSLFFFFYVSLLYLPGILMWIMLIMKCILQFEGNNLLDFCIDMYLLGDL